MRPKRTPGTDTNLFDEGSITDYRYSETTRKNIPPAGLAAQGKIKETPRHQYAYNPHLPPILRSDPTGKSDRLPELLELARQRPLSDEEARILADALRNREPWLEWAGKREAQACEVDPVALHIHERVSAQAILRVAARQDIPRNLFADPEQEYREAVQFYQHDIEWTNRLILGDSLAVMASLAKREDLAGKVQTIYMDPPYGIKFASNFQSEIGKRDVKDKPEDLTREPETIKAYRDTWTLGVHSYLSYLRDRLTAAKELLADSGSVFVQIGEENVHRLRLLLEEVFGADNFVSMITFRTTANLVGNMLGRNSDHILWFAKDKSRTKYHQLFQPRGLEDDIGGRYTRVENADGVRQVLTDAEREDASRIPSGWQIYRHDNLTSQGETPNGSYMIEHEGGVFTPPRGRHWTTNADGMRRLAGANRLGVPSPNSVQYVRFLIDFPVAECTSVWSDTQTGAFTDSKRYVVQTNTKVIERCILMTTDPGDLVLDPTCGSGTTAYVAEEWGRRWITIDTSRVALAIARQRLLTAKFEYYKLRDEDKGVSGGFLCKTVPHITLKSIAQNTALDPIFAKWEPILAEKLAMLNHVLLAEVTPELRRTLKLKLAEKEKREGKKAITDADRRRWLLPETGWKEWEVPFDTDLDWPPALQSGVTEYRQTWRAKMNAVNETIAASAEQEELVDQPIPDKSILRVSGPFTIEGVMPAEESLDLDTPIGDAPDSLETFGDAFLPDGDRTEASESVPSDAINAEAYLDKMIRLLGGDGVRFPDNRVMKFFRLEPLTGDVLHAEGEWQNGDGERRVVVAFGPQYGPITAKMVEDCLRIAYRRGYDDLVFAGFSFDAAAQGAIQDDPNPRVRCHMAHIRPDVNMGGLLKDTPSAQLFTVSGLPRVILKPVPDGESIVVMEGVDIYDPINNTVYAAQADKVAAWFLDSDYDGQAFCICQAFFPNENAWEKLSKALTGIIDADRFAALAGTKSLPFPVGQHKRVAVKVIDPRGNEVMRVLNLDGEVRYA